MTREQIIEILKFYEDPAEDLNHNIRGVALFSHLYEDVADEILALKSSTRAEERAFLLFNEL